ncbi:MULTISPECIES: histidine ammonia-lyase [unclassified Wenzhouxiangella]|uniref:histidine ammonia-lyase n=1 Tax=unclassified Wenzhouxiangella TaxID=2613841 RepID=UPI000E32A671|nr:MULTISPECIES: histidine ammonia-lyase [unclassified Wenzhouxiangella]RFF27548.1 histidine ammonia-lyase [Wenzhouxiangella sp. 15181]RFP69590.1 histidine ammonia-lyase [Wenzhouxiangella sp. 15190]
MPDASATVTIASLYHDLNRRLDALRSDDGAVQRSRQLVERALEGDEAIYGVNTGFGALASKRIDDDQLGKLQRNLLLSHACGTGEPVPIEITRLMMQLKIHALGLGNSGISLPIFRQLLKFCKLDILPWIPSRGSVGASGDLAPLAHMSLPLIGLGQCWNQECSGPEPARKTLARHGIEPVEPAAKDGIGLINGTQLMSAYGAFILNRAVHLMTAADVLGTMSLEALQGSARPFDERVHHIRPHPGQISVAANVRRLLADSEILESHRHCGKVQDPYCLRCIPQVHGASRDALGHAIEVVEREINSVTDNPLVFEDGDIISAGNFHGQPLALSLDYAAMALSELASISERRTYLLLEGHDGLPKLLMSDTGINSGFMIPQYTAAALVSENKVLCHPASVDSIPTSLGQEDHVSMGSISALKLLSVLHNVERVMAVEMLTAAQALDFRRPLKPGRGVLAAHEFVREHVNHAEEDYEVGADIDTCTRLLRSGDLVGSVQAEISGLR